MPSGGHGEEPIRFCRYCREYGKYQQIEGQKLKRGAVNPFLPFGIIVVSLSLAVHKSIKSLIRTMFDSKIRIYIKFCTRMNELVLKIIDFDGFYSSVKTCFFRLSTFLQILTLDHDYTVKS
jgi:hypothetical protein